MVAIRAGTPGHAFLVCTDTLLYFSEQVSALGRTWLMGGWWWNDGETGESNPTGVLAPGSLRLFLFFGVEQAAYPCKS